MFNPIPEGWKSTDFAPVCKTWTNKTCVWCIIHIQRNQMNVNHSFSNKLLILYLEKVIKFKYDLEKLLYGLKFLTVNVQTEPDTTFHLSIST